MIKKKIKQIKGIAVKEQGLHNWVSWLCGGRWEKNPCLFWSQMTKSWKGQETESPKSEVKLEAWLSCPQMERMVPEGFLSVMRVKDSINYIYF